jgi:glutathione peroxidase-family protein
MKSTLNYLSILVCFLPAIVFSQEITDFNLKQTDGSMVSSASYKSKSAWVVVFTGNHCVYSKKYEDRLISLGKEFGAKGVGFLLINSNDPNQNEEESISNMKLRVKEKGYPFVYLQDDQQTVAKMFGAQKNPEVFVLKGSQILFKGAIDNNPLMPEKADRQYLRDALLAIISGKAPAEVSVPANGCNIKWR